MTIDKLIIVVGKAASGKTTLCKLLTESAYIYVSASDVLRKTFKFTGADRDRHFLADRGGLARGTADLVNFHAMLLREMFKTSKNIVLDGPRFAETVNAIRPAAKASLLVFLDCPDSVRRQRLNYDGRSSDWNWLSQHPTETSVAEMRNMADVILDGTQPSLDVLRDLITKSDLVLN